jgi:hypothetical protein
MLGDHCQGRSKDGLRFHPSDAPDSHGSGDKSGRSRVTRHGDRVRLAHCAGTPRHALNDRQMTMRFPVINKCAQGPRAGRAQSHMRCEQRIPVSFGSCAQWFRERRRLNGMIDVSNSSEVRIRAVRQSNRNAVRGCPAMPKE